MQRSQCNCPFNGLQRISVCLNQNILPFDNILQIGSELTSHMKTVIGCERCSTTKRMTTMLSQITSRLVCFYEAAYLNAATNLTSTTKIRTTTTTMGEGASFLSTPPLSQHGQISPPSPSSSTQRVPECQSVICDMKLGKLSIDGSEARMLVEVVLVDACLDLNEKLQEWKLVMDESLEGAEEQCDAVICRCLDRLAKLIGVLQLDGLPLDRS